MEPLTVVLCKLQHTNGWRIAPKKVFCFEALTSSDEVDGIVWGRVAALSEPVRPGRTGWQGTNGDRTTRTRPTRTLSQANRGSAGPGACTMPSSLAPAICGSKRCLTRHINDKGSE